VIEKDVPSYTTVGSFGPSGTRVPTTEVEAGEYTV
jgi:hypothetical protein